MPRRPRLEVEPGLYHIGARGNRRQPIVLANSDVVQLLVLLAHNVEHLRWRCHTFCVLPNHYHFLIGTTAPNLGDGMRDLNGTYARLFNRRYEFGGHLFQGRFNSVRIESESHLLELARYIVLNPVRAGLCRRPEDWPWSSYRATVGLARVPNWLSIDPLLDHFGRSRPRARRAFAAFVADTPTRAKPQ